ncbi:hypothetical protein BU23DRAFT_112920 [Bimuria novae-zelandiae CBS 107.79]|uniref:EGF-like domain-containing protein n=1 Tax=Bimuria novae-zelandiae CBS 107.79 TaxID=1447943 RepID=A0A6A5VAS9_9PLEO|nr:hypothetical protein BU23DRAFT_112920 [Bimuria novae-zelandiae CBS 107.79]
MKLLLLLVPLFVTLAAAQTPASSCQCPLFKCPATNAADLCRCLNSRESSCKRACPTYVPTILPCPVNPPTPSPTPTQKIEVQTTCTCEIGFCAQMWPESCYCANAHKQRCFERCGGEQPELQECPPLETPSLATITKALAFNLASCPQPTGTHAPCGGGRAGYMECDYGETCIKDPYKPGCGPACDQLGICVTDKLCGGFAGFDCEVGQVCEDDPRDECDPLNGGADCGGLCVWPLSLREGSERQE